MTISALVLTLSQKNPQAAIEVLRADPRLELGEQQGNRLPVVAETTDCRSGRDLYDELRDIPGVEFIDVVMVDFSQEEAA